jgi:bis(5'-nucleosyl)-tetraphosphatase (symmetrical)
MAVYAIGDIQGCFVEFKKLLARIQFDPHKDTLWFTGDLVNRGPQSLDVLRFVKALGEKHEIVLGNHDLHLLAIASGTGKLNHNDTLGPILSAPDRDELLDWLQHRPLLCYDEHLGYVMTHAGLAPSWDLKQAQRLAQEAEGIIRSGSPAFFQHMYGNQPDHWDETLSGIPRFRCIINYFTRMRFCHLDGRLELSYKGTISNKPDDVIAWFDVPHRANTKVKIIFGHWAALGGKTHVPNVYALDTGCVWGNSLTAMRLGDEQRFSIKCGE